MWALGLLGMVLAGVYTAISTLPLVDEANFLSVLGKVPLSSVSVYETRFLDVLAMIPVIHISLFALRRSWSTGALQISLLLGQVGLFFFLYHARSSLGWQLVGMIGFLGLIVFYRFWRGRKKKVKNIAVFFRPIFVLVTLITCLITLSIYKNASYNSRYFQDMGTRTFWHNALMGINEPVLAKKYNLGYGDLESARSVIQFAQRGTCENSVAKLDPQGLLNSLGGHGEQDWFAYENCAKKFYFSLWKNDLLRMIYNYLIVKPQAAFNLVLKVAKSAGASASDVIGDRFSIGWHPLVGMPFAFAIVILLVANRALYQRRAQLLVLLGVLLATSLIPSIFFYSAILTMGGFFVTLTIIYYMLLLIVVRGFVRWLYAAPSKMTK
ncbi:hypothetical protein [Polynucleobacter sp. UB-Tiil-W10]|uniref:hypothetical protein n=1 Tax=Polynucleobacter sp. UB-Tiil-W10 TaxID=1855648 RepID=UPI001C0AB833|nr:hypothetical protein [Polynucleobacter sp. UB-Tiil-W10]MBU3540828.1 hypothetical protein [Polynucleobacter sp. UB-Tiil-W10]